MKGATRILPTAGYLLLAFLLLCAAAGAAKPKALFIYWRGETACETGLKQGLKELGVNIAITEFNADQDKEKLIDYLAGINENQFAFIYTFGTTVSLEAAKVIKKTPLLFGIVTNPVESGLVASWETSGRNITGVSHAIPYKDQVDLMTKLGTVKKIGILYDQNVSNATVACSKLASLLKTENISLFKAPVSSESDLDGAIAALISNKVDMVYLPSDSLIIDQAEKVLSALNKSKIPTYGAVEGLVHNGAMIGIVGSYDMVGKMIAYNAVKILDGQAPSTIPPARLPMEMQTVLVNAKTVQQINASIPFEILSVAEILE